MHVCARLREKREAQPETVALVSVTLPINSQPNTTSSTRKLKGTRPKSWLFEPITEEPSGLELWPEFTGSDSAELLKRHHRPRASLPRTNSAPQLVSTTTTSPFHINSPHSLYFILFSRRPSADHPPIASCLNLSCPAATPTTPASAAQAISTSRRRPPASLQRPCATRSAGLSPQSKIRKQKK
jgi:hypothetical protein